MQDFKRYARQIVLCGIDFEGQAKLMKAKVALIGLGGLGSPVAYQLAGMGIGHIRLIDRDIVSLSDLNRQYLYNPSNVGEFKAEVAAARLSEFNPEIEIVPYPLAVTEFNIEDLIKGCDVVLDTTDSIAARYIVNRACLKLGIPYIYGAGIENNGLVFTVIPNKTACLECLFPGLKDEDLPKCSNVGVNPPILSLVAGIQVSEATKIIMKKEPQLANRILILDLQNLSFDFMDVKQREDCSACRNPELHSENKHIHIFEESKGIFYIYPPSKIDLDLSKIENELRYEGMENIIRTKYSVRFKALEGALFNISKYGFAVVRYDVKNSGKENMKDLYLSIYEKILFKERKLEGAAAKL